MSAIDTNLSLGRMQADSVSTDRSLEKIKGQDPDRAEVKQIADEFPGVMARIDPVILPEQLRV